MIGTLTIHCFDPLVTSCHWTQRRNKETLAIKLNTTDYELLKAGHHATSLPVSSKMPSAQWMLNVCWTNEQTSPWMNKHNFTLPAYNPMCGIYCPRVLPLLFYPSECKRIKISYRFLPPLILLNFCFHELLSSSTGYFTIYSNLTTVIGKRLIL